MKNSTIRTLVFFGALAIFGIFAIQTYWVFSTWNVKEQEFHEKVMVALNNVAREYEKLGKQIPSIDLINRVTTNYYVVNINDVINANSLQFFLRRELEAVRLTEDFEYGIYDCATDKMVYGDYISYQAGDSTQTRINDLPNYDKYPYYFGVRFPNRTSQILGSMKLSILFSGILLLTIGFFLYAMIIILRQKRLSEMQKDFINNMTHEFKTPISTIKISADVFLNSPVVQGDERLIQYAGIIRDQNQRLNHQVEKVLQLAKIERDNFKITPEELDLHDLLHELSSQVQLQVKNAGGTLELDLQATRSILVADRLHLSNILHNLIDNAVKYCSGVPQIAISTTDGRNGPVLEVADRGIGIPPEHLSRIFEKFYRVPTGNVHNVKGFGLGLFYVRNICLAHGWKIEIDSQAGQGTTVSLHLRRRTGKIKSAL